MPVFAQQPQPAKPPAFDAASIKPSKTAEGSDNDTSTGYFRGSGTLKAFIRMAYGVPDGQIEGGPKWLDADRYDIEARAEGPADTPELMEMLQTLLADRFKLAYHRESRSAAGYALVLDKDGIKVPEEPSGSHSTSGGSGRLDAHNTSMAALTTRLARLLGKPVADETGTSGFYTFKLTWTPERLGAPSVAESGDNGAASIFTALKEQLGVKLEPRKVPFDVLVIEGAEKPPE